MKNTTMMKSAVAVVAACLVAGSASAMTLTIDRVAGHFSGNGGEFSIFDTGFETLYDPLATVTVGNKIGFQSFCLELNESLTIPGTYDYKVETVARLGGVGGPNPDPLGIGTAWLYQQFATGQLAGYDYTVGPNRVASAGLLQHAIWYLEEELTTLPASNPFLTLVATQYGDLSSAMVSATSTELQALRVGVINPTARGTGAPRQSQLVYGVPDGGLTLGLLGLSLVSLGHIRRRSRI